MRQLTPEPRGDASATQVSLDANTLIDYIRERVLHDSGMPPTDRRAAALGSRLARVRNVIVSETAAGGARRSLKKDLVQKLGRLDACRLEHRAYELPEKYLDATECDDELAHVHAAQEMYGAVISDPGNRRHAKWKGKKGMSVADPVPGSDINDLKILSTAAHCARRYAVELWTRDMDFTMFAAEIYATFGARAVDAYRLGG